MKVLEPGKTKEKWSIQHRCTSWGHSGDGCNALLELEFEDLQYFSGSSHNGHFWGCREPSVSFRCPCCGEMTDLGLNDWPTNYKQLKPWIKPRL